MMRLSTAIFVLLVILKRVGVKCQDSGMKCSLTNLRCDLPFDFDGKSYKSCTTDGVDNDRPWCATKVYEDGTADIHYCMECWGEQRCYYTGESFPDSSWILSCPPGCYHVQKNTYGTNNEFSAVSFVCAAAIHEGLIENATGGVVVLEKEPWRKPFVGEDKNGILTYARAKEEFPMMMFKKNIRVAQNPLMVFSNEKTMISVLQSGSMTLSTIESGLKVASGVALDFRRRRIFWSDVAERAIYSASFDGSTVTSKKKILHAGQVQAPEMLAIDWTHGNLYWTDKDKQSVSVSNLDGKNVVTLIKRDNFEPRAIAVDPKNGYFYVGDSGQNPKIEKCSMAKTDSCQTIVDRSIASPTGIALDINRDTICWVDSGIPQISCAKLDGRNRRDMISPEERLKGRLKQPYAIALLNGKVYWTDLYETILASSDLNTWDSFHIHLGDVTDARGLAVFEARSQPFYQNKCNNAPCEQLCIPDIDSYVCLCEDGKYPQGDGSCGLHAAKLDIYVAETTRIRRHTVNPETSSLISSATILSGLQRVTAVSIDTQKKTIYWSDTRAKKIDMAPLSNNLDSSQKRNFLNAEQGYVSAVEGIAIDSITRLFYWTDVDLHGVYVTNLDSSEGQRHISVLVEGDNTYKPRGIALDPKHGYIYVIDSASPYKIQQCESQGDNCKVLLQRGLSQPNWITVDYSTQRLYFTNSFGTRISLVDFEGENRKDFRSGMARPYGIGVHKSKVYWSDLTLRHISSMDKTTGTARTTVTSPGLQPFGLFLHDPQNPNPDNYRNVCDESDCEFLCAPTPRVGGSTSTCLCPKKEKGKSNAEECKIECEEGYEISQLDHVDCVDIDECAKKHNYGGCLKAEFCSNSLGSYLCKCGIGYETSRDGKSCRRLSPCASNPCENGATCQEDADETDYSCSCVKGFSGKNCQDLDSRLEETRDLVTGAIILQCIVPPGVTSQIKWLLNRQEINTGKNWLVFEDDERRLVIRTPTFKHSGVFACQFEYKSVERKATATVIVETNPEIACGRSAEVPIIIHKVLGGQSAKPGQGPFMAMLYKTTDDFGSRVRKGAFCGGSLIDTRHVVTAAHCFHRVKFTDVIVYLGKLKPNLAHVETHQQSSSISRVILHPEHDTESLHADIAIIILKEKIYYSEYVMPICIAAPDDDSEEVKARPWSKKKAKYGFVYGWGLTEEGVDAERLQWIYLPIMKQSKCKESYPGEITSMMFCVGGDGNKDACRGDSGGPFALWNKKNFRWYLGGVVSWGVHCGTVGKPGVYTRIGETLRQWIYDNTDLTLQ